MANEPDLDELPSIIGTTVIRVIIFIRSSPLASVLHLLQLPQLIEASAKPFGGGSEINFELLKEFPGIVKGFYELFNFS